MIVKNYTILLLFILTFSTSAIATTYYNSIDADTSILASWGTNVSGFWTNPSNFTTSGDIFIVSTSTDVRYPCGGTHNWTIGSGVTLQVDGTISFRNGGTKTLTINGTIIFTEANDNQIIN